MVIKRPDLVFVYRRIEQIVSRRGWAVKRVLFDLLVVLNADFVCDAGMAEAEGFAFSVTNDLSLDGFLSVLNQAGNHWGQVKTAVSTFVPHAVHTKTGVISGKEIDYALHQDGVCRSLIIGHVQHDA